ncbi:MAG TPA: glycosyltransferase family 1 protein [Candidatus Sulfotelmatobacter sp.]|jgi:glycosyltransferase involved in cell wall biosynthesis
MMHLFINSLAASAGGGLTYVRNVLPHLAAQPDLQVTVALRPTLREELGDFQNIALVVPDIAHVGRFWYEQSALPRLIRNCRAQVLLSTGNFALRKSPIPQILLSRNSLYTCGDFYRDLLSRREYRTWLDTHMRAAFAKRSIHWADVTVAPSHAFADELIRWTSAPIVAIHHGFDRQTFFQDDTPLAPAVEEKLRRTEQSLKLLFVSHYNYYRNFETLFRALPLLRDRMGDRPVKLLLTCQLAAGKNPGTYRPEAAAALVKKLGISDMVVELGAIPYQQLHQLYRRTDLYVTPAYAETFAHPLVEAMASGVPVIASDLPVHREICQDAAAYFPPLSAKELAETLARLAGASGTSRHMADVGFERSQQFSWKAHVEEIVKLCRSLVASKTSRPDTH